MEPERSSSSPRVMGKVLVVDDDNAFRVATRTVLKDHGYEVVLAPGGREALDLLNARQVDLVLTDMVMENMTGLALLATLREKFPSLPVIMVTGFGSIRAAVEAMRLGATDYLTKPHDADELLIKIERALASVRKDRELETLREEITGTYSFGNIVSRSEKMRDVLNKIRQVADTDVTILVQGESGTGKELVARALHYNSKWRTGPFVATSCSALTESLLESELFGFEKGAFTGATSQRRGRFEEAHTGTLFLDEIGDISPVVQKKLLRVLQEKVIERIGGSTPIAVDTRIVAATNRDLETLVREGGFREDLFYRLNIFPIHLPPLRERMEDLPLLVEHLLQKHGPLSGGRVRSVTPGTLATMMNYNWRGNVRELENLIRRAIITCAGDTITSIDIPSSAEPVIGKGGDQPDSLQLGTPYKEYLNAVIRDAEEKYLVRMLKAHKGNINLIARHMEIDRKTVYRKLADYSIDPSQFRE
jgi:two-component system, NtrC family, response regulator